MSASELPTAQSTRSCSAVTRSRRTSSVASCVPNCSRSAVCTEAVAAPSSSASVVKGRPATAAASASRQASWLPARNSVATARWPRQGCSSTTHSPETQPATRGTARTPARDSAEVTSTSGFGPSLRTRNSLTINGSGASAPMTTEVFDCSPERTFAGADGSTRGASGASDSVPAAPGTSACSATSVSHARTKTGSCTPS